MMPTLKSQQALEKRAVAPQGNAQGFRGLLVCLTQLTLKRGALLGKSFRQALHDQTDEFISLPDGLSRIIDETSLNGIPARAKLLGHLGHKQGSELPRFGHHFAILGIKRCFDGISLHLLCAGGISAKAAISAVIGPPFCSSLLVVVFMRAPPVACR